MNIIAHRGYHTSFILENTIPAFKKAIRMKYIIELDVHLLKDGNIVVFHDFNLKRMCNVNKLIEECTYEELLKYNLSNTKEKIPLLKTVLNLVNGSVPIIIETKEIIHDGKLEKKLCEILDGYDGRVYIHSFNMLSILWFKRHKRNISRGLIYSSLNNKSFILRNNLFKTLIINCILKVNFISCNKKSIDDNYIKKIRGRIPIFCWTIKNKEEYDKYSKICNKVICDDLDSYKLDINSI